MNENTNDSINILLLIGPYLKILGEPSKSKVRENNSIYVNIKKFPTFNSETSSLSSQEER